MLGSRGVRGSVAWAQTLINKHVFDIPNKTARTRYEREMNCSFARALERFYVCTSVNLCISMHRAKQSRVQWCRAKCNRDQHFRIVISNSRLGQPLRVRTGGTEASSNRLFECTGGTRVGQHCHFERTGGVAAGQSSLFERTGSTGAGLSGHLERTPKQASLSERSSSIRAGPSRHFERQSGSRAVNSCV